MAAQGPPARGPGGPGEEEEGGPPDAGARRKKGKRKEQKKKKGPIWTKAELLTLYRMASAERETAMNWEGTGTWASDRRKALFSRIAAAVSMQGQGVRTAAQCQKRLTQTLLAHRNAARKAHQAGQSMKEAITRSMGDALGAELLLPLLHEDLIRGKGYQTTVVDSDEEDEGSPSSSRPPSSASSTASAPQARARAASAQPAASGSGTASAPQTRPASPVPSSSCASTASGRLSATPSLSPGRSASSDGSMVGLEQLALEDSLGPDDELLPGSGGSSEREAEEEAPASGSPAPQHAAAGVQGGSGHGASQPPRAAPEEGVPMAFGGQEELEAGGASSEEPAGAGEAAGGDGEGDGGQEGGGASEGAGRLRGRARGPRGAAPLPRDMRSLWRRVEQARVDCGNMWQLAAETSREGFQQVLQAMELQQEAVMQRQEAVERRQEAVERRQEAMERRQQQDGASILQVLQQLLETCANQLQVQQQEHQAAQAGRAAVRRLLQGLQPQQRQDQPPLPQGAAPAEGAPAAAPQAGERRRRESASPSDGEPPTQRASSSRRGAAQAPTRVLPPRSARKDRP